MKRYVTLAVVGMILLIATCAQTSPAQQSTRLSSTPREFRVFFASFRSALLRGDKGQVAALTSFPFEYGWDAGDEGTYTRAQFVRRYNDIFAQTRKLFSQKDPTFYVSRGKYDLTNTDEAAHYLFEKKGGRYRFVAFIVEP